MTGEPPHNGAVVTSPDADAREGAVPAAGHDGEGPAIFGPPPRRGDNGTPSRMAGVWRPLLLFAVLAAACIANPATALLVAPFLPLPMAMVAVRRGARILAVAAIGLAAAGVVVTMGEGEGAASAAAAIAFLAGFGALIPAVLSACAMGRPLQTTGGTEAVFAATLLVMVAIAASGFAGAGGLAGARDVLVAEARQTYEPLLRSCGESGRLAPSEEQCERTREQRDVVVRAVRSHTLLAVALSLTVAALFTAANALWMFRFVAARVELPVHRPHRFREFRPSWGVGYLLAAGLIGIMVGLERGELDDPLTVTGICAVTAAGLVMVAQGASVLAWILHRARIKLGLRLAIWLVLLLGFIQFGGVGILLMLAMLDMWRDLRGSARKSDERGG